MNFNPEASPVESLDQSTKQKMELFNTSAVMNPWSSDDIANADLTFDPGTFSLPQTKIPETPTWFKMGLAVLRKKYPNDRFEGRMVSFDAVTNKPCATPKPDQPSEGKKYIYYPRIRCHDCPKKMYLSWSERDGDNFEIHLKNKHHVERVLARIQRSKQEHGEESQSLWPEDLNRARRREEALHDPKEARKVPQIANDLTGVNLKKPIEPVPNDWVASRPMTPGAPTLPQEFIDDIASPPPVGVGEEWFQFFGMEGSQTVLEASDGQLGISTFPGTNIKPGDRRRRSKLQDSTAPWTSTDFYMMPDATDELYPPRFQLSSAPRTAAQNPSFLDPNASFFETSELDPSELSFFKSHNESTERTVLYTPPSLADKAPQNSWENPLSSYHFKGLPAGLGIAPDQTQLDTRAEEGGLGIETGRIEGLREGERGGEAGTYGIFDPQDWTLDGLLDYPYSDVKMAGVTLLTGKV
ncbi:hypothetical protein BKA61DRAFT_686834 [Leptodontidium sp. MPI-SDFR-AT-0119]|nr:hypothetical protein BKA61DRAFT_686834 [Leptodontidium sp. MPI-SDFR-AT-0119]